MLYAGDQDEEESGSEYYDEDLGEALDDMDCSDGVASDSADSSSHADAPTESVFSMIVDTVSASELPEMPKISFAIKPSAPPAPTESVAKVEANDVETGAVAPGGKIAKDVDKKSGTPVLTSRLPVVPDPNRIWSSIGRSNNNDKSKHEPVALSGRQTRRFFDKVDEEVDLEADPILKQVAMNKANPGLAQQGGNSIKDVLARITKPFEEMAANRPKSGGKSSDIYTNASIPTSPHYGELPHSATHVHPTVLSVAFSLLSNCMVLGKLFLEAVLGLIGYLFPFVRQVISHLVAVSGRFSVACSSERNGEFVPVSARFSSAGWCMWAHLSSRNGLGKWAAMLFRGSFLIVLWVRTGTLTALLVIYSYWKLNHEFWD